MANTAYFVTGAEASFVLTGEEAGRRFEAVEELVPAGTQAPVRNHADRDALYFIEDGFLEFMVNGASGFVGAGTMLRVPAGLVHAFRNTGWADVHVFSRTLLPAEADQRGAIRFVAAA